MIEAIKGLEKINKQQREYIKVIKGDIESLKESYKIAHEYNEVADKEIERLKQDNEYLNKVNIELSSRNSKAMKYINEKENNDDNWIDYELLIEPIVLIDILRGSDK